MITKHTITLCAFLLTSPVWATLQPIMTSSVNEVFTSVDWSFQHNMIAASTVPDSSTAPEIHVFRWQTNSMTPIVAINTTNEVVNAVAWSYANNYIAVGFENNISASELLLAHVNSTSGVFIATHRVEIGAAVRSIAWRPIVSMEQMIIGTDDVSSELRLVSFNGTTSSILTTINHSSALQVNSNAIAWRPNGKQFAVAFDDTSEPVVLYTNSTSNTFVLYNTTNRTSYIPTSVGWSPTGDLFAIGYRSVSASTDFLRIYRNTNSQLNQLTGAVPPPAEDQRVNALQWGPFNNLLAVGYAPVNAATIGYLRVYRVSTVSTGSLELLYERALAVNEAVTCLRWSRDQKYLAVGTRKSTISGALTIYKLISADLGVRKVASPSPARPGSNIVYTITVTNSGPDSLTNSNPVTVTDTLPTGLVFSAIGSTSTYNGVITVTGQVVNTFFPVFRANTSATITITALVQTNLRTVLTNRVEVQAFVSDPNPLNNTNTLLTSTDFDGDGFVDTVDFCPEIFSTNNLDFDGDRFGDLCDNCPAVSNPSQSDIDFDLVGDVCDTCPTDGNRDEADASLDGFGDLCDKCPLVTGNGSGLDADSDGIDDDCDNCLGVANNNQADSDSDGIGTVCDNCADVPNADQSDIDFDGVGDLCDLCPEVSNTLSDADGDLIPDDCDPDIDGDLLPNDWELLHGFDPFDANTSSFETDLDPDLDEYSNIEEYIAGTNPTNQFSNPAFSAVVAAPSVQITWPILTGRLYDVFVSTNLMDDPTWLLFTSGLSGTGASLTLTVTNAANERHFRYQGYLAP